VCTDSPGPRPALTGPSHGRAPGLCRFLTEPIGRQVPRAPDSQLGLASPPELVVGAAEPQQLLAAAVDTRRDQVRDPPRDYGVGGGSC
jgi:hypothetical protein